MTNLQCWRKWNSTSPTPDLWIDLGWYYCVAAALERRVWYGEATGMPIFTNIYAILCGPPSAGKSLLLDKIKYMLFSSQAIPSSVPGIMRHPYHEGPDRISYACFVEKFCNSTQIHVLPNDKKYSYAAIAVVLSEFVSMFPRNEEDIPKMFLDMYDGRDYKYATREHGNEYIYRPILNFISGIQPDALQKCTKYAIFGDGFISRIIFAFEAGPRHDDLFLPPLTSDQIECRDQLVRRIAKFKSFYGNVDFSPAAKIFLLEWYQSQKTIMKKLRSPMLSHYIGRRKLHLFKLAMAAHFSDSDEMEISESAAREGAAFLDTLEDRMAAGFSLLGNNPLYAITEKIALTIRLSGSSGISYPELAASYLQDVALEDLQLCLQTLILLNRIRGVRTQGNQHPRYYEGTK